MCHIFNLRNSLLCDIRVTQCKQLFKKVIIKSSGLTFAAVPFKTMLDGWIIQPSLSACSLFERQAVRLDWLGIAMPMLILERSWKCCSSWLGGSLSLALEITLLHLRICPLSKAHLFTSTCYSRGRKQIFNSWYKRFPPAVCKLRGVGVSLTVS